MAKNIYSINDKILQNIIDALPVLLYWTDKSHIFLGNNLLHAKFFGYSNPNQLIGKSMLEVGKSLGIEQNIINSFYEEHNEIMSTGTGKTIEYSELSALPAKDGKKYAFLSHKQPLRDENNNIIGLIGISMNIDELKKTQNQLIEANEKAEAANRAKAEFIANMSHDIRTPLSGISGIAELLLHKLTAPQDRKYCQMLVQSTHDLTELFNGIIGLMKSDISNEIEYRPFHLHQTLDKVFRIMQPTALAKDLKLTIHYQAELPCYLLSHQLLIHRIVLNLVSNAIKFTENGWIAIKISMKQIDKQDLDHPPSRIITAAKKKTNPATWLLIVEVIDSGIGIPKEKQENIFERFTRLNPSYEGKYKGAGLGLYTVKDYAEKLQGKITIDSTPKKGSHFTCQIPVTLPTAQEIEEFLENSQQATEAPAWQEEDRPSYKPTLTANTKGKKVLLVEDNLVVQTATEMRLAKFGCQVDIANSGEAALELIASHPYDLIFLDIGLPGIDGITMTQQIRAQDSDQVKPVPIIAVTAHASDEVATECLKAGMNRVVHKPLSEQAIIAMLNTYLSSSPADHLHKPEVENPAPIKNRLDDELTIIELSIIKKLKENHATTCKIFSLLANTLPKEQQQIATAYQQQDWPQLQELVHKLHGALCYTGTPRLKNTIAAFEIALVEQKINGLEALYNQFCDEVDAFFAVYNKL